jgi:hypothetical protein
LPVAVASLLPAPRHHLPRAALSGAGLPGDRLARLAARRAFLGLRQTYLQALDGAGAAGCEWLRRQVCSASEPGDLWLLRGAVFAALPQDDHRRERAAVQLGIEALFPSGGGEPAFTF